VNWGAAPRNPILRGDEVHVWLSMTGQAPPARGLPGLLSVDEIERANRFYFSRDRERFIHAHGVLRTLLGRYVGADPARLRFSSNRYGKPALAGEWAGAGLNFNLSHSHEVVLYAFAFEREVGVDVEHVRPELAGEEIAARFFAAREAEALRRTPDGARAEAFFSCWTRKEAYVKAVGEGLSIPLDSFVVSVDPEAREVSLEVGGAAGEGRRWGIVSLRPAEEYVAALAAEGSGWQLKCWRADV
jgi:4'-phosphopantetheinyl transferase